MSASKKRRKAREWMHKQAEQYEKRLAWERASYNDRLQREIDRLTRVIPKEARRGYGNDIFFPQGKIDKPYIRLAIKDDMPPELVDPREPDYFRHAHAQHIGLRATQHALVLPDGTNVVWFGWEMDR